MRRSKSSAPRKLLSAAIAAATSWMMSGCTVTDDMGSCERSAAISLQLLLLVGGAGLFFILLGAVGSLFD